MLIRRLRSPSLLMDYSPQRSLRVQEASLSVRMLKYALAQTRPIRRPILGRITMVRARRVQRGIVRERLRM